jgi:2-keto-3-deoxy-L-rhamnonate aldolase RhmA
MLRPNPVKQALRRGTAVYGTMLSEADSPAFVRVLASAGYDFVFIDMEHGVYSLSAVAAMIGVARLAGVAPLVRVPDLSYQAVAQALDAGAMGLMLPRVETRAQAEAFVSYMKYPPVGVRGASGGRGHTDYEGAGAQELVQHMNEHTLAILQIERRAAIERIDDLLSVPGVDAAVIGPFDLTISLGEASPDAPAVAAAIQQVVEAARRHGVASGIHTPDADEARRWRDRGMTLVAANSDLGFFKAGAQRTLAAMRGEGAAGAEKGEHI